MSVESTSDTTVALAPYVFRIRATAASDPGRTRSTNQDSLLCRPMVFAVADGLGGHEHGDRASQAVVAALAAAVPGDSTPESSDIVDALRSAHDAIAIGSIGEGSSGTTAAGVALVGRASEAGLRWMVFNVGDSRVYDWSNGVLSQITVDHSAVQELIEAGELAPEAAQGHPERNVITRALGMGECPEPDIWLLPVRATQTFLICSDGLTKELADDQVADILAGDLDGDRALLLVEAALRAGGRDNVTVVLATIDAQLIDAPGGVGLADASLLEDTVPRA